MEELKFTESDQHPTDSISHDGKSICLNIENNVIIEINKDGFFYKGEKVTDVHNVYERFNEWLTAAQKLN